MASFRRTLSPVLSPFQYRHSPSLTPLSLSDFLPASFPLKHLRRTQLSWRRSISSRCLLFFLLGIFLGLISFRQIDEIPTNHDSSFHIKPQRKIVSADHTGQFSFNEMPRDLLIVVTPTYNRALQAYYLNRLGQVLKLVNAPLLWIVVEMEDQSLETAEILRKTSVMYRHLVCPKNLTDFKDRGIHQRNAAIEHIQQHRLDGIVYFADDDNVYSLELFERVREISRFGTWPVAMLDQSKSKAVLEGAVCDDGQIIGWHTNEKSKRLRRFHVDMSGFAFNSTILWDPRRWRRLYLEPIRQLDTVKEGFQETTFIEQLVADESQMEGLPVSCDRILNWHLHLNAQGVSYPRGWALEDYLVAVEPLDR